MSIVNLIFGLLLLLLGRKFYWLFVGIVGFIVGFTLAGRFLADQAIWLQMLIAVIAGLLGAGLAVLLQRFALAIAGFLAGGNFLASVLATVGIGQQEFSWVLFLIGGVIGAILVIVLFDWALIILSSLTGANLIVQSLAAPTQTSLILLIGLAIIGIIIQAGMMRRERTTSPVT